MVADQTHYQSENDSMTAVDFVRLSQERYTLRGETMSNPQCHSLTSANP